ncbi:MAG: hypothetical protein ACREGH_03395 [Minisyncoccia bacterium]
MFFFKTVVFFLGIIFFVEVVNVWRSGKRLRHRRSRKALSWHIGHVGGLVLIGIALAVALREWHLNGMDAAALSQWLRISSCAFAFLLLIVLPPTLWFNGWWHPTKHWRFAYPTLVLLLLVSAAGFASLWQLTHGTHAHVTTIMVSN